MEFDTFVVLVIVVMVMAFILSIGRRGGGAVGRMCPGCGAVHPPQARFCRRCGHRL